MAAERTKGRAWSDGYPAGWKRGLAVGFVRGGVFVLVFSLLTFLIRYFWGGR